MAFYGVMILRDESDVIAQTLTHMLTWIDGVFILDLGSVDGTWDILQDMALRDKRIVPWKQFPVVFSDNLRSMIFDQFRGRFRNGDWIGRTDGDEFYHVAPPTFVKERLGRFDSAMYLQWYYFRLTAAEVARYDSGEISIAEDRKRPIGERRRFYKISEYAEPRFFKYRRAMQWPEDISFPFNAGYVARERIPILHYPHRDPLQMACRFNLRAAMMKLKAHAGGHWKLDDWRKEIVDAAGSTESRKTNEGIAGETGIDTGAIHEWKPGEPLKEVSRYNHIPKFSKRFAQRLIHPMLLPILDRRRPTYNKSFTPRDLPQGIQEEIARAYKNVQTHGWTT